jgi:hypothetical protein
MSENFVLLTEEDFNNYLKLQQQQENNNKYHKQYLKKSYEEVKINNPEKYKLLMQKQNEKNKKY